MKILDKVFAVFGRSVPVGQVAQKIKLPQSFYVIQRRLFATSPNPSAPTENIFRRKWKTFEEEILITPWGKGKYDGFYERLSKFLPLSSIWIAYVALNDERKTAQEKYDKERQDERERYDKERQDERERYARRFTIEMGMQMISAVGESAHKLTQLELDLLHKKSLNKVLQVDDCDRAPKNYDGILTDADRQQIDLVICELARTILYQPRILFEQEFLDVCAELYDMAYAIQRSIFETWNNDEAGVVVYFPTRVKNKKGELGDLNANSQLFYKLIELSEEDRCDPKPGKPKSLKEIVHTYKASQKEGVAFSTKMSEAERYDYLIWVVDLMITVAQEARNEVKKKMDNHLSHQESEKVLDDTPTKNLISSYIKERVERVRCGDRSIANIDFSRKKTDTNEECAVEYSVVRIK